MFDTVVTLVYSADMEFIIPETRQKITFDFHRFEVRFGSKRVHLSQTQVDILKLLLKADGHVVTRPEIAKEIWGTPKEVQKTLKTRTIDQHISRIRRAIPHGHLIFRTVAGKGYCIPQVR